MVVYYGSAVLAFAVAALVAWLELVTSKYPRTMGFLAKRRKPYLYATVYGAISFFVMLGLHELTAAKTVTLEGTWASNPWLQALAIGLSTKALLHIRLFTVTVGSQPFPVGVESVVQLFEPWLLESIDLDEWQDVRAFVVSRAAQYPNRADVEQRILNNLPNYTPEQREAMRLDLSKSISVSDLMQMYLRRFGPGMFDLAFPPLAAPPVPPGPPPVAGPPPPAPPGS